MKCSSRLLCGLLISCLCFRVTDSNEDEELSVNQSPSSITVKEGDSAQITCCWSKIKYKVKVYWYNNETRLSDVKQELQERETQNCSMLNFTNILKNASGHYVCEVTQDIPVLIQKTGSGTALFVKDSQIEKTTTAEVSRPTQTSKTTNNTTPTPGLTLPISLAAAIGLLTLCLAFSVCKMRNSCKKSERVVIHQTPHSEGEEHENMEEEAGSTGSSRGSLQWYQVPVYWSYFDLRRGEDQ
ncbi:uncharacterized protein LOC131528862 isoform X4 [Onychostoma macrolepis]|uniref:Ig-like domain-containing protein n=1 Tax=Onychostoma macrolepis TaxID=369639 RepID=A0A7J6BWI2_9TELE|nr:uncharacterized protein LOC131528862 isoform X4 [Onychostoma macrolepis]XP_058614282.1 uncharacterized protein LOC131528862 isoform X4 [Onychostoma macrolepis]KAF4098863.1 hypothetical protein G5714_020893 [Onychostoma macrolepis]